MRIGILGGSFDPIHKGHMHMAQCAYQEYNLDEIWIIPAGHSPNKDENKMTSSKHRLEMCIRACNEFSHIKASDYEIRCSETSYTYRTLQRLKEDYPQNEFYFIMGADSIDYFEKWIHPEIIAQMCVILVVIRDGFLENTIIEKINNLKKLFPADIKLVHCDKYDISSSEIRNKLYSNQNVREHLNSEVYNYIIKNDLYQ